MNLEDVRIVGSLPELGSWSEPEFPFSRQKETVFPLTKKVGTTHYLKLTFFLGVEIELVNDVNRFVNRLKCRWVFTSV